MESRAPRPPTPPATARRTRPARPAGPESAPCRSSCHPSRLRHPRSRIPRDRRRGAAPKHHVLRRKQMALKLGDTAPDFEADTTQGKIRFHDWIGDSWAVLFSHPKDFTPVCTTELGYMASIKPEFDKRGVKIIGLSADPVARHEEWSRDIEETQGAKVNYPMIGDADLKVAKLYNMLPADEVGAD